METLIRTINHKVWLKKTGLMFTVLLLAASFCPEFFITAPSALAAISSAPNPETWSVDGEILKIVTTPTTTYLAGTFKHIGPQTGCGTPVDTTTGAPLSVFPRVERGNVEACVSDGSGGWFIGGSFNIVNGVVRNNLAHILSNGKLDTGWKPNPDGSVRALAISGSTVYAAGSFENIGGAARKRMAALDVSTGLAKDWNPSPDGWVHALAVSGSTVYVGGGEGASGYVQAIDISGGAVESWATESNSAVRALAISGSTVYAGGDFTNIGGAARHSLAALNGSNGLVTVWNPKSNDRVRALAVSGLTVYVGGNFTNIGGGDRRMLAALSASTGLATDWNPGAGYSVHALAVSGSTVYVGGSFTSAGGEGRNNLAAIDSSTGIATAWNPNPSGAVYALAVSGSTVYVGGHYTHVRWKARNYLAALDATTGAATDWNPNPDAGVRTIAVSGSVVYVGGYFTSIGGKGWRHLAAIDSSTGVATDWNPNPDSSVCAIAISGSTVYAAGSFKNIGGAARKRMAALDVSTGLAKDWNPSPNNDVLELAIYRDAVYVCGYFSSIGGQTRNSIAALDDDTGDATDWNPNPPYPYENVRSIAISGSIVYVGGDFKSIGGKERYGLAALDASTGLATDWNPSAGACAKALAVSDRVIYAGGANFLEAVDISTGMATDWNPVMDLSGEEVCALAVSGSTLYAGGSFFARFDEATARIVSITPAKGAPGETLDVDIVGNGTHFLDGGSEIVFSDDSCISVESFSVQDATHAKATITISDKQENTTHDVNVITGYEIPEPLFGGFSVQIASTWYFAEGTCRPGFDPYLCIQNPGDTAAEVTITYMLGDGNTSEHTLTVIPHSRSTVSVKDHLGEGNDAAHDFSAKVTCTTHGQRIIAERPMYFNYNGVWTGGHNVMGANSPSGGFPCAEGTCRPGFDPYLCIQNPGSTQTDVTITYMNRSLRYSLMPFSLARAFTAPVK